MAGCRCRRRRQRPISGNIVRSRMAVPPQWSANAAAMKPLIRCHGCCPPCDCVCGGVSRSTALQIALLRCTPPNLELARVLVRDCHADATLPDVSPTAVAIRSSRDRERPPPSLLQSACQRGDLALVKVSPLLWHTHRPVLQRTEYRSRRGTCGSADELIDCPVCLAMWCRDSFSSKRRH